MPQKDEISFIRGLDTQGNLVRINRSDLAYNIGNFGGFTYTKGLVVTAGMTVKQIKEMIISEMKNFFSVSTSKARMMYLSIGQGSEFMDNIDDDDYIIDLSTDVSLLLTSLNRLGYAYVQLTSYGKPEKKISIINWKFSKSVNP